MPNIFSINDFGTAKTELQQDYFDRHTPVIQSVQEAKAGEIIKIRVRVGTAYPHPHESEHYIAFIQLWNRESLLAETRFYYGSLGCQPGHAEVEYTLVMPQVSMNLTALSYCTKHGLWKSQPQQIKVIPST
ncbi:MAG: desulfoferrodoxin family protein [Bacteroidales bacterium]